MATTYELIVKAVDKTSGPLSRIEKSLQRVERANRRTNQQLGNMGKQTRGIQNVSKGFIGMGVAINGATVALVAAGAGMATLINAGKEIQNIEASLKLVTFGAQDLADRMDKLRDMAVANKTSFSATADLFTKLSIVQSDLGFSTQQTEKLVNKMSRALIVSGADANTASGAVRQFGQAMASGTVRGDEFVSISEALGPALAIIAKESGVGIAELRELSQAGELTAKVFADMLLNSTALEDAFDNMGTTTDQLETQFSDAFTAAAAAVSEASGLTAAYNKILLATSNILNNIADNYGADEGPLSPQIEAQIKALQEQKKALEDAIISPISEDGAASEPKDPGKMNSRDLLRSQAAAQAIAALQRDITREQAKQAPDLEFITRLQLEIARLNGVQAELEAKKVEHGVSNISTNIENLSTLNKQIAALQSQLDIEKAKEKAAADLLFQKQQEAMIAERIAKLEAHFAPATEMVEEIKKLNEKNDKYGALKSRLMEVRAAQELLIRGFNNGILRMGAGTQATLVYKEQLGLLAGEAARVKAEMDELTHKEKMLTDVSYRAGFQFETLKAQLMDASNALIKVSAEAAINGGASEKQAFQIQFLKGTIEELNEKLKLNLSLADAAIKAAQDNTKAEADRSQAVAQVTAALKEGLITQQQFIFAMSELGIAIDTSTGKLSSFAQFYENLLESSREAVTGQENVRTAVNKLNEDLSKGLLTIDQYAAAMDKLGLPDKPLTNAQKIMGGQQSLFDFEKAAADRKLVQEGLLGQGISPERLQSAGLMDKPDKPDLTASQELTKSLGDQKKAFDDLVASKANVAAMAQQAGVSVEFMRKQLDDAIESANIFKTEAELFAEELEKGFRKAGEALSQSLARDLVKGRNMLDSFKNFFDSILEQMLQAVIQKAIMQPFMDSLMGIGGMGGGGGIGGIASSIFGFLGAPGFRAEGGPVTGNSPYIVGEKGPELFMPGTTGRVVPNNEMGAGGGGTPVTFQIQALDSKAGTEFILENKNKIINMINSAQRQRGKMGIMD